MSKQQQAGFTLIELVMVIVILGVLAAVALPKFVSVDDDAKQVAVDGVAGALSSASAINYASRKAKSTKGVIIANCTDVEKAMQSYDGVVGSGLPQSYVITSLALGNDETKSCTVTAPGGQTAKFTGTGISS